MGLAAWLLTGLGAAPADAAIYWSNQQTQTIGRANLDGSGVDNAFVDVSGATDGACAVAVGNGYVYWTGGGQAGSSGARVSAPGRPRTRSLPPPAVSRVASR